jgi:2'-5' RNA ligase
VSEPFLERPTESDWALLLQALAGIEPFLINYGPVKSFLPYPCIWYDVQPAERVLYIREILHQTGLFNLDQGYIEDFIPHMTITEGQSGPEVTEALLEQIQGESKSGSFFCEELIFSAPGPDFHFRLLKGIPLGGSKKVASSTINNSLID